MAAAQEKEETCEAQEIENTENLTVSGDGTWQKRGFSSLYGVSSLIGYYTGKVIDICVKSGVCQTCKIWDTKLNSVEFEEWHENHVELGECEANHEGPAGNMEVSAIKEMFQRSEEKYGVKYKYYVGDGDSKTYTGVVQSQSYGEDFIHSYEPFPDEVITAIEPIYEDLSKDELLQRCLGGFTQNNNESLNQLIWRISPKVLASSPTIIEIAANAAACTFNEGYIALLAFLEEMKINVGPSAHEYVKTFDESRILKAEEKAALQTKEARILRRMEQKDALDLADAAGTLLYGAGIDDSM